MKLGADDPKKLIALGALVVIGGYLMISNLLSSPSSSPATQTTPAASTRPAAISVDTPQAARPTTRPATRRGANDSEFHPVLHPKRPEDRIDPSKVDPTLRLDLLAKVQTGEHSGPGRNVFQFGPQPLPPEPKVIPPPIAPVTVTAPPPPSGPPPPPPLNITLKYYGFSSVPGSTAKTAFFLDGEDILVAKEGEMVKRRYKVVRIGATSAVLEDTESKQQKTIPLAEEAAAG